MKDNQPTLRAQAEQWLRPQLEKPPHAQDVTDYGGRIEIRRLWAHSTNPESAGLYAATQVYVVEREVIPKSPAVNASKELCYGIVSMPVIEDRAVNGTLLLSTFRGHWTIESKNHYPRDVSYREDRSPVKNHNAARVLAAMKMLAIFLSQIGAHRPKSDRERTLPEFNRACAINGIDRAMGWMMRKYNPLRW